MRYFSMFSGIGGLYKSGKTQKEIADIYGVSQAFISRLMKKLRIKARVAKKRNQTGANNDSWKGDKAGYAALHYRVEKARGKPKYCEKCKTTTAKRYEWASLTKKYQDINDYIRLCKSCHHRLDGVINNIRRAVVAR